MKELVGQIVGAIAQFMDAATDAASKAAALETAKAQRRIEDTERQARERLNEYIRELVRQGISEAVRETKTKVSHLTNETTMVSAKAQMLLAQQQGYRLVTTICGVLLCLGILLGWLGHSWILSIRLGFNLSYLTEVVEWNTDRIAKCQVDNNPKCTIWIVPPEQR